MLALSLIAQDDGLQSLSVMKIVQQFQRHLKVGFLISLFGAKFRFSVSCSFAEAFVCFLSSSQISDAELLGWKELVAECMSAYHSSQCSKPDNRKLVWIVSRRTAQGLQSGHFSVPALPTIPEISWDQNERFSLCFFSAER